VREFHYFSRQQLALAGAAGAGLAGKRKLHARPQERRKDGFSGLRRHRLGASLQDDLHAVAAANTMVSGCLGPKQNEP
jgi:hypothetical protein